MDLKGSLVNTHLRIYPSAPLTDFLKSLPEQDDIPENILKFIGRSCKANLNENAQINVINFTDKDLENIKTITDFVQANTKTEEAVADSKQEKVKQNEKEKSGDTPEKRADKEKNKHSKKPKKGEGDGKEVKEADIEDKTEQENEIKKEPEPCLHTTDIDWLYSYLENKRNKSDNVPYLHALLEGSQIEPPENEVIKRNPELEARCVKLRAQAEHRAYRKMTKGVDNVRMRFPEDSIAYQMKQLNRHLIAVGQFIISIFAGFLFGFKGIEWSIGQLDFGFRLLLGVMFALIIALAEIYFLAKKLNEELSVPETVQLGGPVKFVEEHKYRHLPSKPLGSKEHQD